MLSGKQFFGDRYKEWKTEMEDGKWPPFPFCGAIFKQMVVAIYLFVTNRGYNGDKFLSTMEVYDPALDKWELAASMCTDRGWPACAVLDNKLFVMGGRVKPGEMLSSVEVYTPELNRWTMAAPMQCARDGHSAITC